VTCGICAIACWLHWNPQTVGTGYRRPRKRPSATEHLLSWGEILDMSLLKDSTAAEQHMNNILGSYMCCRTGSVRPNSSFSHCHFLKAWAS
jgi:hypothetical protein